MGILTATVLFVDDDRNLLRAFRLIVEAEGFRVLTAQNADTAMAIATSESPNIVVTDYMMPDVDGAELCRRLKSNRATAGIPVVMLTATFPLPSGRGEWNALLTKPVAVPELLMAIRSLLTSEGAGPAQPERNERFPHG
jgi:two-component system, chemotaxis family, response regulator PixH